MARRSWWALGVALAAACSLPPLRGKAQIGKDRYLVFVADAAGGSDLFAMLPEGGAPIPLTFSAVDEMAPALSPDGATVAFLRAQQVNGADRHTVWLLNLLSGGERELPVPASVRGVADRVAWSADGQTIYIGAGTTVLRASAPPAASEVRLASASERPAADSSFTVLLGRPVFGAAVRCGDGLCVAGIGGASSPLAERATGPTRWGGDSVGYFRDGLFEVRPLGPGHARVLDWKPAPVHPRDVTFFAGKP